MRKRLVAAVAAGALGLGSVFSLAPLLTIARYQEAAERGRTEVLAALTDGSAVQASVRGQVAARLVHDLRRDPELLENPLGGFGLALSPSLADARAEILASPRGVAVLILTGEAPRTPVEVAYPPSPPERGPVTRRVEVRGLDEVRLKVRPRSAPEARTTALVFRRRGLLSWRAVAIDLPAQG